MGFSKIGRRFSNIYKDVQTFTVRGYKMRSKNITLKVDEEMNCVNIFRYYSQAENRYTSGLISLLKIGSKIDNNILAEFGQLADISLPKKLNFKVLRDYESTADAEISDDKSVMLIETKIVSGTLRDEQIKEHLNSLDKYKQKNKRLILLTPDSANSHYIKHFINIAPRKIVHVTWNSIIQLLQKSQSKDIVFSDLVCDYIDEIKNIFEQDKSAVIVKINFDKSGVDPDDYLREFKNGEWGDWHTPKKYNELDGKGKKLILYDNSKGLVSEAEIEKVGRDPERRANDYPWSNKFVKKTLKIYSKPIPLSTIKEIPDKNKKFSNFDRCSTSHWNLTREQYEWLTKKMK